MLRREYNYTTSGFILYPELCNARTTSCLSVCLIMCGTAVRSTVVDVATVVDVCAEIEFRRVNTIILLTLLGSRIVTPAECETFFFYAPTVLILRRTPSIILIVGMSDEPLTQRFAAAAQGTARVIGDYYYYCSSRCHPPCCATTHPGRRKFGMYIALSGQLFGSEVNNMFDDNHNYYTTV